LGDCRETWVPPLTGDNFLAAVATATREAKAATVSVVLGSYGLVLGVSALNSTGPPALISFAHDLYRTLHFVPLLST
jgi:sugar (pentulose or hexulose) kinase